MFTGLVENVGIVKSAKKNNRALFLQVATELDVNGIKIGDSICVNGVCLTVNKKDSKGLLEFVIMPATVNSSCLADLRVNDKVNIERAMVLGGRLDGHIVTGHVDGTARVIGIRKQGDVALVSFIFPESIAGKMFLKASVAINGVSLTVQKIAGLTGTVSLVPLTRNNTNLGELRIGTRVNIESDYLVNSLVRQGRKVF